MPSENSDSLIPKPSTELSVGSGAERVLSEMTGDALKIHEQSLKQKFFKIGDVELCEPDYRFIEELAKRTEWDEKELLDWLVGIDSETDWTEDWNGYETIKGGHLTRLHFDEIEPAVDMSQFADLTQLEILCIFGSEIVELIDLSNLTQLRWINFAGCDLSDVSPLSNLTQLEELGLSDNQITDVSPLSNLTQLEKLFLTQNQITDVGPLSCLTQLEGLYLYGNQITDVSPLSNLTQLKELLLMSNPLKESQIDDLRAKLPDCIIHF